eukprot:Filipodium_phascolosomae@DN1917_c0_g1_i2.p1
MNRIKVVSDQLKAATSTSTSVSVGKSQGDETTDSSITVVDNRTGKKYNLRITENTIQASDLKAIRVPGGPVLRSFDPGYSNTASCRSKICYIDGDAGILQYRGYPIEQLAEFSTFSEVAFLLFNGELPTPTNLEEFEKQPMAMFMTAFTVMGTVYPQYNPAVVGQEVYKSAAKRNQVMMKILGLTTTIAAMIHRHRAGLPQVAINESLGFVQNFLFMIDSVNDSCYRSHPKLVRALDILFILHAEHELNCSTAAIRHLSSSSADVFTAAAAATGALYGPRHGGANEAVVRMLQRVGKVSNVPTFLEKVKRREELLMGFGHRVYKNYDPRAKIIKAVADEVLQICGSSVDGLVDVAVALEKAALEDNFFVKRKLYPNVDFYSGLIYRAMGFPTDFFPVLFAIPRTAGWLSHWAEFQQDPDNKIVRPFQIYEGPEKRDYVPITARPKPPVIASELQPDLNERRRQIGRKLR